MILVNDLEIGRRIIHKHKNGFNSFEGELVYKNKDICIFGVIGSDFKCSVYDKNVVQSYIANYKYPPLIKEFSHYTSLNCNTYVELLINNPNQKCNECGIVLEHMDDYKYKTVPLCNMCLYCNTL